MLNISVNQKEKPTYVKIVPISELINKTKGVSFTTNRYRRVVRARVPLVGEVFLAPHERTVILPEDTADYIRRNNIKKQDVLKSCAKAVRRSMVTTVRSKE